MFSSNFIYLYACLLFFLFLQYLTGRYGYYYTYLACLVRAVMQGLSDRYIQISHKSILYYSKLELRKLALCRFHWVLILGESESACCMANRNMAI